MIRCVQLEKAAEQVCDQSAVPPLIFQLPPEEGRRRLDEAQNLPVYMYPARIIALQAEVEGRGTVPLYGIVPDNLSGTPNLIFYIHGGGWVFGNLHTHEKLVRELAARTNSIVLFPEYSLSPEAQYPAAIEQCYAILQYIPEICRQLGRDYNPETLTVAGDSVGGNMAAVMGLLSKFRGGIPIHKLLLYYPVTNANFNTASYLQFACDYYLYRAGMMWFWDQYAPNLKERREITASPLLATLDQLQGLPQTMIINGEADVLRDEGEAFACKLRAAGVPVSQLRVQAIIHDFVMLNALDQTQGCRAAMDASTQWLNRLNAAEGAGPSKK